MPRFSGIGPPFFPEEEEVLLNQRDDFDHDRSFVVAKPMTMFGRKFVVGEAFDKNAVTPRRLKVLYDQRFLTMTEQLPDEYYSIFDPARLSNRQLILYLEDNGLIPRPGATREWLIGRVRRFMGDDGDRGRAGDGNAVGVDNDAQNAETPL